MEENLTPNKTMRIGFVAADAKTKVFDSGKKVTNVTILSGSGDQKQATYVRGWNAMADRLKEIKKGEKWEFKGALTTETNDGKNYDVLTAKESYPHVKMEIQGEVKHIEDKKLGKTNMKNIMVVSSEMKGGREISEVYNIELYGEKNLEKAKGIKVGDIVSTKGHARLYDYEKDGVTKINKAFQNPLEIKNHTVERKAELKTETKPKVGKDVKLKGPSIKSKIKGKGLQM